MDEISREVLKETFNMVIGKMGDALNKMADREVYFSVPRVEIDETLHSSDLKEFHVRGLELKGPLNGRLWLLIDKNHLKNLAGICLEDLNCDPSPFLDEFTSMLGQFLCEQFDLITEEENEYTNFDQLPNRENSSQNFT